MIGKLKGIIDSIDGEAILLDVNGVGYLVQASPSLIASLTPGDAAALFIETHVREDHIHLFGFASAAEREWFRALTSVQRVGNRMALSILGAMPPAGILQALMARDTTAFSRISGIGPKLAERIVAELHDKALKLPVDGFAAPTAPEIKGAKSKKAPPSLATRHSPLATPIEDAVSALANLGYGRAEAYGAALRASKEAGGEAELDALIRLSLRELASA